MNFLANLFSRTRSSKWRLLRHQTAERRMYTNSNEQSYLFTEYLEYEIWYKVGTYKLELVCKGRRAKRHRIYSAMQELLAFYRRILHERGPVAFLTVISKLDSDSQMALIALARDPGLLIKVPGGSTGITDTLRAMVVKLKDDEKYEELAALKKQVDQAFS